MVTINFNNVKIGGVGTLYAGPNEKMKTWAECQCGKMLQHRANGMPVCKCGKSADFRRLTVSETKPEWFTE